ncbi:MAG: PaaX family transcriptional regulator C-terminal domain-containing protein [Pseudomonadota bacterium]
MSVTAKNLTLDLLTAIAPLPLSVRHLLASGALFAIPANNLRVCLARLSAEGLIESIERGSYRLSASATDLATDVSTWRTASQRVKPWHGEHITVYCGALGRSDRAALRHRDRALQMLGFQELERGLHVRPDNLDGGVEQVRRRLYTLGLERQASVFVSAQFDAACEARIRSLWNGAALNGAYTHMQSQLADWSEHASQLSIEEAARECYLVGRKAIRQVVFDPLLPTPLVDVGARQRFFESVLKFDNVGRDIWRQFHSDCHPMEALT